MTTDHKAHLPPDRWYDRPSKPVADEIIDRLIRIETRLVKLMLASGLDSDGKPMKDTMPG